LFMYSLFSWFSLPFSHCLIRFGTLLIWSHQDTLCFATLGDWLPFCVYVSGNYSS
jgi:hypothetical protein